MALEIILVLDIYFKSLKPNGILSLSFLSYMVEKWFMFMTEVVELAGVDKIQVIYNIDE